VFREPYCWAGLVVRIGEAGNEGTADSSSLEQGEYGVTGDQLHEVIRSHGTHVEKIRAALHTHKGA